MDYQEIRDWLREKLATQMDLPPEKVDIYEPFVNFGIRSAQALTLVSELERKVETSLPATLLWDCPNIYELSRYLAGEKNEHEVIEWENIERCEEPIAIVGMACRTPQAKNLDEFWHLLSQGVDAITEVPENRWNTDDYYEDQATTPGKMTTKWGGFLEGVDQFDANFFGISPREAASMDPQQRILLETSWEAIEDGGILPKQLSGTKTGVFIGISTHDYSQFIDSSQIDPYSGTGNAHSIAANRLSYFLNLQGPSIAVDTACSSSLAAVHLACQSIRNGESQIAIAGGVNLILSPDIGINFSKAGVMASDGRCKTFDSKADGYVRSEGVGVVVLKPLSKALEDRDRIYCVIRGSAINQDGRSNGLMSPSGKAQEAVLLEAYRNAGISPSQINYIEAHGTGTAIGDPIEVKALGNVLRIEREPAQICRIGSVKTNIGHLEAAAGIAGLIKVALCIWNRKLVPNLHYTSPNPEIPFEQLPLAVQTALEDWETDERIAGISSFGFGGTNCHVVVSEPEFSVDSDLCEEEEYQPQILCLSAPNEQGIKDLVHHYLERYQMTPFSSLTNICYTANVRRTHHSERLSLIISSQEELQRQLEAYLHEEPVPLMSSGSVGTVSNNDVVFVFPGQGSQWIKMGRELYAQEPAFRRSLQKCDDLLQTEMGFSILDIIWNAENQARLDETDLTQPALFAIQIALADLWRAWGIQPSAIVGHSMGEVAAAYVSGALSLEDAVKVIVQRGKIMKKAEGKGKMLAVELSAAEAKKLIASYEDQVSIAAINHQTSIVLSGDPDRLQKIHLELDEKDVFNRFVRVDLASHSPHMEPLKDILAKSLEGISPQATSIPIYSTVTGQKEDGTLFDEIYWSKNLRETVKFHDAYRALLNDGYRIFIEISPNPALKHVLAQGLDDQGTQGLVLSSMRREEDERSVMLSSLGALYVQGLEVNWEELFIDGEVVTLPSFPWQHQRHWIDESYSSLSRKIEGHPLLGVGVVSSLSPKQYIWETEIHLDRLPYLADHTVQGKIILPGAVLIEQAVEAAHEVFGKQVFKLSEVEFQEALFLNEEERNRVQTIIFDDPAEGLQFSVFRLSDHHRDEEEARLLARGKLEMESLPDQLSAFNLDCLKQKLSEELRPDLLYQQLWEEGLQYGPAFQGMKELWKKENEALAQIGLSEVNQEAFSYQIHPVLLDAGFQALSAILPDHVEGVFLPVGVHQLHLYEPIQAQSLWCYAKLSDEQDSKQIKGNILFLNDQGKMIAEVSGLTLKQIETPFSMKLDDIQQWYYRTSWKPVPLEKEKEPLTKKVQWVIFADQQGVAERISQSLKPFGDIRMVYAGNEDCFTSSRVTICPTSLSSYQQFLQKIEGEHIQFLYFWGLDEELESLVQGQAQSCLSLMYLLQALKIKDPLLPAKLWVVTSESQEIRGNHVSLEQAPVWAFAGTIASEHPELECVRIDFHSLTEDHVDLFVQELLSDSKEDQIAFLEGTRYVARLTKYESQLKQEESFIREVKMSDEPVSLTITEQGVLDHLHFEIVPRKQPRAGEVEIEVYATALNFKDVMNAMGVLPDGLIPFGMECSGRIVNVGEGVTDFQLGDEVVAFAMHSFSSYTIANAHLVAHKPKNISFEQAATLPVAYLTAYYALEQSGRLSEGERVLIHSAAGGVGLAAIQIAKKCGAEVFATSGSPMKREYLKKIGINHVMDSRNFDFVDEIKKITNGQGVDVVLNSLSGEYIEKSLSVLGDFGRFLEIGKTDIYQNRRLGLYPFHKNLSYFAIELSLATQQRPEQTGKILKQIMQWVEEGVLEPLELTVFPIEQVVDGFRYMATRKNIGKIVFTTKNQQVVVKEKVAQQLDPNGTYMITGGLTGIGLLTAQQLVEQGAKHLVLLGRRKPNPSTQEVLNQFIENGTQVVVKQADVSSLEQMENVMQQIEKEMPPLKGVIHSAGILQDALLTSMKPEQVTDVMKPKVMGAWNLHLVTKEKNLDFFILYSSAASLLGSPGQANYSAANAFLDALAHLRVKAGLPGLAINWGPWSQIGLAATQHRGGRIEANGMKSIHPAKGMAILSEWMMERELAHIAVLRMRWEQFLSKIGGNVPFFEDFYQELKKQEGSKSKDNWKDLLVQMESNKRKEGLQSLLKGQISRTLGVRVEQLDVQQNLNSLGLDSLMSVELKNYIESQTGVSISITTFLQGPSISDLAEEILAHLKFESINTSLLSSTDELNSEYPLSYGQQSLWFMNRVVQDNSVYNIVNTLRIKGDVDVVALKKALYQMIKRHAVLRTTFPIRDKKTVQQVHETMDPLFTLVDASSWMKEDVMKKLNEDANQPFDLEQGPLFRVSLYSVSPDEHYLLINIHHIISDGWSLWIMVSELMNLYEAEVLNKEPDLPVISHSYMDFTNWQQNMLEGSEGKRLWLYWQEKMKNVQPFLTLPTDYERPKVQSYQGDTIQFTFNERVSNQIREFCGQKGLTPYVIFMATLQTLLYRYSGQNSIVVGSPSANRTHSDLEKLIGYFVNMLPMRAELTDDLSLSDLLDQVKETVLEAFDHQAYPFPLLVKNLQIPRDPSYSPLFQVAFVWQKSHIKEFHNEGLSAFALGIEGVQSQTELWTVESVSIDRKVSMFDLTLHMADGGKEISGIFEYSTSLFRESTLKQMIIDFKAIVQQMVTDPTIEVGKVFLSRSI